MPSFSLNSRSQSATVLTLGSCISLLTDELEGLIAYTVQDCTGCNVVVLVFYGPLPSDFL